MSLSSPDPGRPAGEPSQGVPGRLTEGQRLKARLRTRLLAELEPGLSVLPPGAMRARLRELFEDVLATERPVLTRSEREELFRAIEADILGLGPLQALLDDPSVTEVMVNGPFQVYVEREGKLLATDVTFDDEQHVMRIIERILAPVGRRVDEASPIADARLPDGSRVNVIIPPISLIGPMITVRKFPLRHLSGEDLVRLGAFSSELLEFLRGCVVARLNILVSGGTASGKTTLLNVLSGAIPEGERVVTIEDAAELRLQHRHWVRLETRPPNVEGKGEITTRDLVRTALRIRPDRIIVGEVRGGEALDMLQAMNTGHDGSLSTVHANSPSDALRRIETLALFAGIELPLRAVREQIASAIDLVVHQERLRDGRRVVTEVAEVLGLEGDSIATQALFVFQPSARGAEPAGGRSVPTGRVPRFLPRLRDAGVALPEALFGEAPAPSPGSGAA